MAKKNYNRGDSKPLAMRIFILVVAGMMAFGVVASSIAMLIN